MSRIPRTISVLKGGPSGEHAVSLRTGAAVAEALRRQGYKVNEVVVMGPDFIIPEGTELAFICLHGAFGEDGQVQRILADRGLRYTGSGIAASRAALDKEVSRSRFELAGIPIPHGQVWRKGQPITVAPPLVIKPSCEGSSLGLQFVECATQLDAALSEALKYGDVQIIEEWIRGKELTVGIVASQALPIIEIRPKGGRYDYSTKYTLGATDYLCPAPLSAELTARIHQVAIEAHQALGCVVYSRVDIMLDENERPWVLEINTIPGMTETSLLPKAAQVAGFSFDSLCKTIAEVSFEIQRNEL